MPSLLVDIGNTRTKWRMVDPLTGFANSDPQGAVLHAKSASLAALWRVQPLQAAWIVNVAQAGALAGVRAILDELQPRPEVSVLLARAEQSGVINGYRAPERLGADRWAMLIGARALYPQSNVLIASLGTATTIDLLRADGRFVGGVILPGIALMRHALARNTAGLPLARGRYAALARDTDDAITSGILHAQAGAIERVLRDSKLVALDQMAEIAPSPDRALCLLAGGDAALIQPRLPFFTVIADNLVLRGLLEVARDPPLTRAQT
jgi:type III pantothenate kinase